MESRKLAFPLEDSSGPYCQVGLTKREWFAGMALCGLSCDHGASTAKESVYLADSLIRELKLTKSDIDPVLAFIEEAELSTGYPLQEVKDIRRRWQELGRTGKESLAIELAWLLKSFIREILHGVQPDVLPQIQKFDEITPEQEG